MDVEDLRKFMVVAQLNNLQLAAKTLHQTPGALSKVVMRLEVRLGTQLFDRTGRNIVLNRHGEKFRHYASQIVHEADQALSEFVGSSAALRVNIAGPSVLISHWLPKIIDKLGDNKSEINISVKWESEAINLLANGSAHLALVTDMALDGISQTGDYDSIALGTTLFKVVAGDNHPLFKEYGEGRLSNAQLFEFPFACPSVSPFCGITRGIGSDGWRDDKVPRQIGYRCNDFSVLMSLVRQGRALAYVPDFIATQFGLRIIDVDDCDYHCQENIQLVYKPSLASGWLNQLIAAMNTP